MKPPWDIAFNIGMVILAIGLPIAFFMPFIQHWVTRKRGEQSRDRMRTLDDQVNDELWDHLDRKYWHEQGGSLTEPPSENPSEA
ncbi:MAG TPA: hypothetical protein VKP65_24980 [Rhodothermales bacterium]|nr:hypothetical protein [Rhodothermales bacterium]